MKFSLRYLLAYLDDILEPADTAEVSRLLKEDLPAAELVARIKNVIRQRRLSASDILEEAPGKDANDVAEYLDNLFKPEQINQFEQKCLDSDEQLAEVAATHQILTLIMGSKSEVPDSTMQRLMEIADSIEIQNSATSTGIAPIPLSAVDIPTLDSQAAAPASKIPPAFNLPNKEGSWKKKGAFIAVGLLFAGWIFSIITDESLRYNQNESELQGLNNQLAQNQNPPAVNNQNNPADPPSQVPNSVKLAMAKNDSENQPNTKNPTEPEPESEPEPEPEPIDAKPGDFQPPIVKPAEPTKPGDSTVVMNNPKANPAAANPVKPEDGKPAMAKPNPNAKPEPAKPVEEICFTPTIVYDSEKQALIRQAIGESAAVLIPTMTEIEPGDQLFCTRYSIAEFTVGSGKGSLKVFDDTAITLLGADEKSCLGLNIRQGKLVFSFQPDPADKAPKRIRITMQELTWYVELPKNPGSLVFEVTPQHATHYEQLPAPGLFVAKIWTLGDPVQLTLPDGKQEELKIAKQLLPLPVTPTEKAPAKVEPAEKQAEFFPVPNWVNQTAALLTTSQKRDQREFNKKITGSVNLWLDLEGAANDPNPRLAELAARALSLGNRTESLITVLVHSPHEESRTAAIFGLRTWLPQSPDNREKLKALLSKKVNESTAFIMYNLLWGYDAKDAKDPELSRQLVTWLRHDHVAVRELSIYWISHLTNQKLGYRPQAPLNTREQGVVSWERHLNRVGALVTPVKKEDKQEE